MRISAIGRHTRSAPGPLVLRILFAMFCLLYVLAVIGVAFDVKPPFPMDWAASFLLYLEGVLLLLATAFLYGRRRAVQAGLLVIILSYLAETLGVTTGFPFGRYVYTAVLLPSLPGGVPLPVMFAWVLVIFGVYGWVRSLRPGFRLSLFDILAAGTAAVLLDGAIEPVAAHIVDYWRWAPVGSIYYGIPLVNFVSWFVLVCLLVWLTDRQFAPVQVFRVGPPRLALRLPRLLFALSLLMFFLIDLAHGYYGGCACALLSGLILLAYARRR
ncbi:hypothetical protein KSC_050620 [Ktedonobacter sp. SOSP1-52]|uniref:carotenoid biosynthesis protein n=1 Tax=Ktedonobacter sp. SOSP1-52 TaxID=2778366 RepID=UPI001916A4A4|nr:carotenoid biosynthesis protein [Ktedonobacter sp. SOSP1-52]GHO66170.1 hypothetical protein KSC_050620 [Ktedonobacter sp. SOSP1-52]